MTIKDYYINPFSTKCIGKVIKKNELGIIFDKSIAYPEGGGQIGDSGYIRKLSSGEKINFYNTTKEGGRKLCLKDFPEVFVESNIIQHIEKNNLETIKIGDTFEILIDIEKRTKSTINHSGIHVVLMAIEKLGLNLEKNLYGAKISETNARLDFHMEDKFTKDHLEKITIIVNDIINKNKKIEIYQHEKEDEAYYWKCGDYILPCGGTHLRNTGHLGKVFLKRKTLGKSAERIIATFEECTSPRYN